MVQKQFWYVISSLCRFPLHSSVPTAAPWAPVTVVQRVATFRHIKEPMESTICLLRTRQFAQKVQHIRGRLLVPPIISTLSHITPRQYPSLLSSHLNPKQALINGTLLIDSFHSTV